MARTTAKATRAPGPHHFLLPLRQDGVEIRPIRQVTGTSRFNEVFFDSALAQGEHVVEAVNDGWKVRWGPSPSSEGVDPRPADALPATSWATSSPSAAQRAHRRSA
ncbi:MAG: hypothetical protein R2711_04905 [Acidimicrobiales bacterium]